MSLKRIRRLQARSEKKAKRPVTVKPPRHVKADSAEAVQREDRWVDRGTGMGIAGRDKAVGASFCLDLLDQNTTEALWRGDDMAAKIVEVFPEEMSREGFELEYGKEPDEDAESDLEDRFDELDLLGHFTLGEEYARAHGGGALYMGVDDGRQDIARPLVPESVKALDFFLPLTPRECVPFRWYGDDPEDGLKRLGEPKIYQVTPITCGRGLPQTLYIHESRLLIFNGTLVSRQQRATTPGRWGDSIFVRVLKVVQQFQTVFDSSACLVTDFAMATFKMAGLAEVIASESEEDGDKRLRFRMAALEKSRSNQNVTLIDKDEEFKRETTTLTGLPDLMMRYEQRLAAAADTPASRLMGQAPAGLNATGDSDIRWFFDRVKARQHKRWRPNMNKAISLIMRSMGRDPQGENWEVCFNPLWQLDPGEEATRQKTYVDMGVAAVGAGILSAQEVAVSFWGSGKFDPSIKLESTDRQALADQNLDQKVAEADALGKVAAKHAPKKFPPGKGK